MLVRDCWGEEKENAQRLEIPAGGRKPRDFVVRLETRTSVGLLCGLMMPTPLYSLLFQLSFQISQLLLDVFGLDTLSLISIMARRSK